MTVSRDAQAGAKHDGRAAARAVSVLSRVLLMIVVACAPAALATASPAFAEKRTYSCEACTSKPGPDIQPIDFTFDENRSGEGVCAVLWKYNGGTSYNLVERKCEPKKYNTIVYKACIEIAGHGDVESTYKEYNYKLWGEEGWTCD